MERAGISIMHLEVGEPDFDTPQPVVEAAMAALRDGKTHYTHSLGLLELREAVAAHYLKKYGARVSPEQVIVTSGTSPAMSLIFATLLSPGDEVILTDPHYACYPNFIRFADGAPVPVPAPAEAGYQFDPDALPQYITKRTAAVLANSPSNPAGTLLSADALRRIADLCIPVVSDEIYHGLVYEGREHSILEYTDNAFVINGFSKLYAMTGWRVGYLIAPKPYIRAMQRLQQNFYISANSFVQWAALAALEGSEEHIARMVRTYDERRRFLVGALKGLGFELPVEPTGAFYVFVDASHVDPNSYQLSLDILENAHVAVTPGIDFGARGEGHIRFSYANSIENIEEGVRRLRAYLQARGKLCEPCC
jgi:aspartate/methionine/tyrosine aminotransferase